MFLVIAMGGLFCDDIDLYTYVEKYSNYGPVWDPTLTSYTVTLYFPEDAVNVTETSNYSVTAINNGTVAITTVTYDSTLRKAEIIVSFSGTDGSGFYIKIVKSSLPIIMGGLVLDGYKSPVYPTDDLYAPSVEYFLPTDTSSSVGTHTMYVVFSEAMDSSTVEMTSNYTQQYSGSITMDIPTVTYDAKTNTAIVTVEIYTGSVGDQYRIAANSNITDAAGNNLTATTYSSWYTIE